MNELEREGEEKIEQKPVPPSETGLGATFGWAMVLIFVAEGNGFDGCSRSACGFALWASG
jgi:hypothetical protein